jgi:hypothetical protein
MGMRFPTSVPLSWRPVRLESVEAQHQGTMVDVSTGGCCVELRDLPRTLGLGSVVEIELRTDAGTTTRRGLVVADPGFDGRLHLALRVPSGEQDLVALLT